jgi:hypothetical protein
MPEENLVRIEELIVTIRGQRVILAADLARIYGAETRVLNQAVKRNLEKFPADFLFRLTLEETETLQRSRSQIVILKRGSNIKYLPYAFTEHGAIMAANVLNIPRAIQMSVFVVRAFVRLRQMLASNVELARRLDDLEKKYDAQFKVIFDAIRALMRPPDRARRSIGFRVEEAGPVYRQKRARKRETAKGER